MKHLLSNKLLHKWISVLVGIQFLIWLGTGLYFNLMDHRKASGNELRQRVSQVGVISDFNLKPLSHFSQISAESVNLVWVLGKPYYEFVIQRAPHSYQRQSRQLFDATNGKLFALDEQTATQIAKLSYKGKGIVSQTTLFTSRIDELPRQQNPVWQVRFEDQNQTNVYVDAVDGRVLAHINDDRRLRNLMFKLHFMDYFNTGGFNHWLIIVFALLSLVLSVTGVIWLIELVKSKQIVFALPKREPKPTKLINLVYLDEKSKSSVRLNPDKSILEGLHDVDVFLPSECGGSGSCGKCKFVTPETLPVSEAERLMLSESELEQGYRLGCQHKVSAVDSLVLNERRQLQEYDLVLTRSQFITPFIKEVRFKLASGQKLNYKAGSYMQFQIPSGTNKLVPENIPQEFQAYWHEYENGDFQHTGALRSYSLASSDCESDELVFNVRWQTANDAGQPAGVGSSYLGSMKEGEQITALGPVSEFANLESSAKTKVYLGAGSGVAPLRSMLKERFNTNEQNARTFFLFGARSELDIPYREEFERMESTNYQFTYVPILSNPNNDWRGKKGYVQDWLTELWDLFGDITETEFYLCGPKAMMLAVEDLLLNKGANSTLIFKDDFGR